jgi:hypothetical protein
MKKGSRRTSNPNPWSHLISQKLQIGTYRVDTQQLWKKRCNDVRCTYVCYMMSVDGDGRARLPGLLASLH